MMNELDSWSSIYVETALGIYHSKRYSELYPQLFEGILLATVESFLTADTSETAKLPGAREALLDALRTELERLRAAVRETDGRFFNEDGPDAVNGVLRLDEVFATFLEGFGTVGRASAQEFRKRSKVRWGEHLESIDRMRSKGLSENGILETIRSFRWRNNVSESVIKEHLDDALMMSRHATSTDEVRKLHQLGDTVDQLIYRHNEAPKDSIEKTDKHTPKHPGFQIMYDRLLAGSVYRHYPDLLRAWVRTETEGCAEVISLFTIVLWADVVSKTFERELRNPPALVRAVHQSAMEFHSRVPKFDEKKLTLSFEGRELARIYGSFDASLIENGLSLLGSVWAHKLFRWEVITGHEQALQKMPNPHIIHVEGGWTGLARKLGLDPGRPNLIKSLRAILHAQRSFQFKFPDGSEGNMLVLNERPATGRDRAYLRIELGAVLLPSFVHQIRRGSPDRKLIPLLREPIPLHGRANEHGQQLTMSLQLVAEMRARAMELVEEGGVTLTHDAWTKLADRSGVKRSKVLDVQRTWLEGNESAPPFLEANGERFSLSAAHSAEQAFLLEAGRTELAGAHAGRRSVEKKRSRLR
jgi:hypothetical protein